MESVSLQYSGGCHLESTATRIISLQTGEPCHGWWIRHDQRRTGAREIENTPPDGTATRKAAGCCRWGYGTATEHYQRLLPRDERTLRSQSLTSKPLWRIQGPPGTMA